MFAIIFIILTAVLTVFYYKHCQCSGIQELFGAFVLSIGTQVVFFGMVGLIYGLYMIHPL
jgi:hypothetical protein